LAWEKHRALEWNEMEDPQPTANPVEEKRLAALAADFPVKVFPFRGPMHAHPPRHPLIKHPR
jgi:hypothetical protein